MTSCRYRLWACFRSGSSSCSHSCEQSFHEESTNQNSFSDHCGLVLDIKPPQQTCSINFFHNLRINKLSVFKLKSILKILKQDQKIIQKKIATNLLNKKSSNKRIMWIRISMGPSFWMFVFSRLSTNDSTRLDAMGCSGSKVVVVTYNLQLIWNRSVRTTRTRSCLQVWKHIQYEYKPI